LLKNIPLAWVDTELHQRFQTLSKPKKCQVWLEIKGFALIVLVQLFWFWFAWGGHMDTGNQCPPLL